MPNTQTEPRTHIASRVQSGSGDPQADMRARETIANLFIISRAIVMARGRGRELRAVQRLTRSLGLRHHPFQGAQVRAALSKFLPREDATRAKGSPNLGRVGDVFFLQPWTSRRGLEAHELLRKEISS